MSRRGQDPAPNPYVVLGIDLTVNARKPSGVCVLRGQTAETMLLSTDEEMLELALRARASLVTIDAPLSLPPGRKSIHDRNGEHYRACDLDLRARGIRFFPITLGAMRGLTERGIGLKERMTQEGLRVVEIFPGASQDVWGLPRKQHDLEGLRRGLRRLGLRGIRNAATHDELDAATAALTGLCLLQGTAEILGSGEDDGIVVPGRTDKVTPRLRSGPSAR